MSKKSNVLPQEDVDALLKSLGLDKELEAAELARQKLTKLNDQYRKGAAENLVFTFDPGETLIEEISNAVAKSDLPTDEDGFSINNVGIVEVQGEEYVWTINYCNSELLNQMLQTKEKTLTVRRKSAICDESD